MAHTDRTTAATAASKLTARLNDSMTSAGYEMPDALYDALVDAFTDAVEVDLEDDTIDAVTTMIDALAYAAQRVANDPLIY